MDGRDRMAETILRSSGSAFKLLYGSVQSILLSREILTDQLPDTGGIDCLILNMDGTITAPHEPPDQATIDLPGVPIGLIAIVAADTASPAVQALMRLYEDTNAHARPALVLAASWEHAQPQLVSVLGAYTAHMQRRLSDRDNGLVHLRRDNERLRTQLSSATLALRLAGYRGDTLVHQIPVPQHDTPQLVGPAHGLDRFSFSQPIYADISGINRVVLEARSAKGASGKLIIMLVASADNHTLKTWALSYADIKDGPLELMLGDDMAVGAAVIKCMWQSDGASAPGLLLGAATVSDDGDTIANLALSLYRNVAPVQDLMPYQAAYQGPFATLPIMPLDPVEKRTAWAEDMGFPLTERDPSHQWLQLHPVTGSQQPRYRSPLALPPGAVHADIWVSTDHDDGPTVTYWAKVVDAESGEIVAEVEKLVVPARKTRLGLDLSEPLTAAAHLDFGLYKTGDQVSFGWCRWFMLDIACLSPTKPALPRRALRVERLTNLMTQSTYIAGPAKRQQLFDSLGLPVLTFHEDDGYVETHPVKGQVSGLFIPDFVPAEADEIMVDFYTAHEATSRTLFATVIFSDAEEPGPELANKVAATMAVLDTDIDLGEIHQLKVDDAEILYTVLEGRMPGQFGTQITPAGHARSIALITWLVADTPRYGWCRWKAIALGCAQ